MNWETGSELIPLKRFKQMRKESPVMFDEELQAWNLFKYEDAKAIFADHERFSSQGPQSAKEPIGFSILMQDPPKHRQLRKLVSQAFTPRAVDALASKIESIARELCDRAEAVGKMDALHDFASPLPIVVIADMLGVPAADLDRFKAWSDSLVGNDFDRYIRCQEEMGEYFGAVMNRRRLDPQDDLITRLVHAKVEGERLSDVEIIGFCILLLVAGNETTTNLITSALLCLDSDRAARRQLIQEPQTIPQAIEETLRYCSPVQTLTRTVKQAVELRGHTLLPGQTVHIRIGSANHDEDPFETPERFDIRRDPNPHLAFGHGIHYCLGAQLARLESRIALETLLARFPRYGRDRSHPLKRQESWMMFGVTELPLILEE